MGFNVNFNSGQFDKIEKGLKRDINEIIGSPAVMNEVGEMTVERLKFQSRVEEPFNQDKSFPLLRESTIRHREYLARYNKTHSTFESGRANLTITGAFLDSLTFLVKGPGKIELYFDGTHPRYQGKNGAIGKDVKNSDLFNWLKKKGFAVFDSSISENKTLRARVRSIVLRYIRRGLKVRNNL